MRFSSRELNPMIIRLNNPRDISRTEKHSSSDSQTLSTSFPYVKKGSCKSGPHKNILKSVIESFFTFSHLVQTWSGNGDNCYYLSIYLQNLRMKPQKGFTSRRNLHPTRVSSHTGSFWCIPVRVETFFQDDFKRKNSKMKQTRPPLPRTSSHLKTSSHFRGRWSSSRLEQGKKENQILMEIIAAAPLPKVRANQVPFLSELR